MAENMQKISSPTKATKQNLIMSLSLLLVKLLGMTELIDLVCLFQMGFREIQCPIHIEWPQC